MSSSTSNTPFFEATVTWLAEMDNGLIGNKSANFLVDAMSFTEAEARLTKELDGFKEVSIKALKRSPIKEVVTGDTGKFHLCKIKYSTLTESEDPVEKTVTQSLLVDAETPEDALAALEKHLSTMQVPYTVAAVIESKIVEVFYYVPAEKRPVGFKQQGGKEA